MSGEIKEAGPRLVVIEGKEKGKVIPLKEGVVIIGRSKGDLVIPDARISRSHVSLHFDAKTGKLSFEDLKSLNGTQRNGETLTSGELKDGDKLQVGNTVLDCLLSAAAEEKPAKTAKSEKRDERKPRKARREEREPAVDSFADALRREPEMPAARLEEEASEREPRKSEPVAVADEPSEMASKPLSILSRLKAPKLNLPRPSRKVRNLTATLGVLFLLYGYLSSEKTNFEKPKANVSADTALDIDSELVRLQAATEADPANSDNFLALGKVLSKLGRYDEALAAYRKARALPDVSPVVHPRLIGLLIRTGLTPEVDGELNALDKALREGRHSRELFVEAATLYLDHREIQQPAEKALILAKALQTQYAPGDPVGYKLEVQALQQAERTEEALAVVEKGLALSPNDEWFLENQAFIYLSQKEIPKAVQAVETWLTYFPNSSKPLLVMGYLKFNQKDYASVGPYVQRIIDNSKEGSRDPFLAEALSLMGQVYDQQNKPAEANAHFQSACDSGFQAACTRLAAQGPTPPAEGAPEGSPDEELAGTPSSSSPSPASLNSPKAPEANTAKRPGWPARTPNGVKNPPPKK